jgi:hypothetical protein
MNTLPQLSAPRQRSDAAKPALTIKSRMRDEVEYFARGGMTDAELEQYARRTAKRPGLCFAALAASPFVIELLCRLFASR